MQYISPFSLLETVGIQYLSHDNIPLAKKMLSAELELAGGSTILIKGRELTKNDILVLIDSLRPESNESYHRIIANDAVLRNFLENCVLENGTRFKREDLYNDLEFIEWLSPYYFTSFSKLSVECISSKLCEKWNSLLSNPLLMNAVWTGKAWAIIEELVQIDLRILHSFNNQKRVKVKHGLQPLVSPQYIAMLQLLPDERFLNLKDEYAYLVMQYSIQIFNTRNKQDAILIISRALSLAVSTDIQQAIESTRVELFRHYRIWQKGAQDRLARKIAFGGVLIFIVYLCWKSWTEPSIYNNEQNDDDSATYKAPPAIPSKTLNIADSLKLIPLRSKYSDTTINSNH